MLKHYFVPPTVTKYLDDIVGMTIRLNSTSLIMSFLWHLMLDFKGRLLWCATVYSIVSIISFKSQKNKLLANIH